MYQILSAIGQPIDPGSAWEMISVENKSLAQLSSEYSEVYFNLSNVFWESNRTAQLSQLRKSAPNLSLTLQEFLESLGNKSFPTIDKKASVVYGEASYTDAVYSGYKLTRGHYLKNPEVIPHPQDAPALIMRKSGVDARYLQKNALINVNGLFYRSDADSTFVYVDKAMESVRHCGNNNVGVLSFAKVGSIETVPIKKEMLSRAHAEQPYKNQVVIHSPVKPGKRTAAIVFGGYLMLLDNLCFSRIGEDTFILNIQNIALIERYYESKKIIDMSFLGLETKGANKLQISTAQLTNDEVLTKWLTMHLSFLVFIDTDNIAVHREQLRDTRSCKNYISSKEPKDLIVYGSGLAPVYWKTHDDGQWLVSVDDTAASDYLFNTIPQQDIAVIADNVQPWTDRRFKRAYTVKISTQKIALS